MYHVNIMRIIQATCEVVYDGRCRTFLPRSRRLIMMKDDDTVLVHANVGTKPINYMPKVTDISYVTEQSEDGTRELPTMVVGNAHETLHIRLYDVIKEDTYDFPQDDGGIESLVKSRSEDDVQAWLVTHFEETFGKYGIDFVCREFETGKGPVDLLGVSDDGTRLALIEVKRHAKLKDAYQVLRYRHATGEMHAMLSAKGVTEYDAYSHRTTSGDIGHVPQDSPVTLDVGTLENPMMFLVAERFTSGAVSECEKNGIITVRTHAFEDME